ncbi:hypothetical protein BX666DRAFT_2023163 [Dichotomocladium elegans]|nr:hypothetical protein BX666DRAFT_2023163 [Dichotomocladium elegans]
MISGRVVNILLAIGIGVGTGVETKGTWMRPGDEERLKRIAESKEKLEKN